MTEEQRRADRHPTDEPDGTPAYEASLRAPGASVTTAADDEEPQSPGEDGPPNRAGYDEDAVSGDSGAYRPD